jgi:Cu(I)/Ag(I) efflux system membrane fusion protein
MKRIMMITGLAIVVAGSVCYLPHRLLAQTNAPSADRKILYYTCPMHPSVKSDKPGKCPECGMKLQPVYADASGTNAAPARPSCGGGCCGGN